MLMLKKQKTNNNSECFKGSANKFIDPCNLMRVRFLSCFDCEGRVNKREEKAKASWSIFCYILFSV